jgi:hypothetical protein
MSFMLENKYPVIIMKILRCFTLAFIILLFATCRISGTLHAYSSGEWDFSNVVTDKPDPIEELISSIDTSRMLDHISTLSDEYGVRTAGTVNERLAANYIAAQLERYSYTAYTSEPILLGNQLYSQNVWAELPGDNPDIIIVGAHMDSKPPSPGANDDGSGVAVVLELASLFRNTTPPYTLWFVFFGAEEIIDSNIQHHHYGSRFMAGDSELIGNLYAAASIDMVGVGTELWIDNMGEADDFWRRMIFEAANNMDLPVRAGEHRAWSDHEAFEYAGVPSAWIHWRYDNEYHKETDTSDRIDPELLAGTTELMIRVLMTVE